MTAPTPDLGRIVVDPRFRERRIAVRRQAGRRRLKRLLVLVAVAVTALTAVVVLRSPVLDVDAVAVAGARYSDPVAIQEAAGIGVGSPLLLADLDGAEEAIEALPWVEDATVRRDLPGDVVVEVEERTPAAVVTIGRARVLVDHTGRVLGGGDPAEYPSALRPRAAFVAVAVSGSTPVPAVGDRIGRDLVPAVALADRLREDPAGAVASVRIEPSLQLDLADGGRVDLGDPDDLDAKVEAFRTAWARIDLACIDTLDLRVPTHPVLTREDGCS